MDIDKVIYGESAERQKIGRQWLMFLVRRSGIKNLADIANIGYDKSTTDWYSDYEKCMKQAELGEPTAVTLKEEYLIWILTK